jgi:hypothetical protein
LAKRDAALDDAATDLEHVIESARTRAKADIAQAARLPRPIANMPDEDPYGIGGEVKEGAPQLGSGAAEPIAAPAPAEAVTESTDVGFIDDRDIAND